MTFFNSLNHTNGALFAGGSIFNCTFYCKHFFLQNLLKIQDFFNNTNQQIISFINYTMISSVFKRFVYCLFFLLFFFHRNCFKKHKLKMVQNFKHYVHK